MTEWEPGDPVNQWDSHYPRNLMDLIEDHIEHQCAICQYGMCDIGGGMRWSPQFPIGMSVGPVPLDPWHPVPEVVPF